MQFLRPKTPIDMLAPGVDPSLNREPPSSVDVRRMIFLIGLLLLLICGGGTFILAQVSASGRGASALEETPEATEEPTLIPVIEVTSVPTDTLQPTNTDLPTSTATLDDWSLTGTALFFATSTATFTWTPTLDYCWWLTPSPTPSVTPNQPTPTLDDWQAQGTQVFIEKHTLTPTPPPTQRPPRVLCDGAASPTPEPTETSGAIPTYDGRFPTLDSIAPPATWTDVPAQPNTAPVYQPPPEVQQVVITSPPQVVIVTAPPQNNPPVLVIVTATSLPASLTPTPSAIPTDTLTPTLTPSNTATLTFTPSPSNTPTDTPTSTFTPSPTPTLTPSLTPSDIPTNTLLPPTETPLPTATFTPTIPPTALPSLAILSGNCDAGHLTYGIQNSGGDLLEQLQYRLIDQFLLVNSTGLFGGIPSGQTVMVDLGSPEPGLWILGFDYLGQTVYSSQVTCSSSEGSV